VTLPVSVLIPTRDEEENLPAALESVRWADEVVVVDSHSSDRTVEVATAAGARVVQFDHPGRGLKKKNWALEHVAFRNEWVLLLDADERVTPSLRDEIETAIAERGARFAGYCIDRELRFMGAELACFRPNWNLRLFRHHLGRFEDLGLNELPGTGDNEIHEHVVLDGRLGFLREPLLHDDDRGIGAWLERHNRYATWEAHLYRRFRREPVGVTPGGFLRLDPFHRKRVLRRVWVRLPCRPLLRFVIWYVARRGFRGGRAGFVFCLLMAWYELIIGIKLRELEHGGGGSRVEPDEPDASRTRRAVADRAHRQLVAEPADQQVRQPPG
jgi:glycosyltransferase involved in cell wall biosynthesis